jgi:hypothetical protein
VGLRVVVVVVVIVVVVVVVVYFDPIHQHYRQQHYRCINDYYIYN